MNTYVFTGASITCLNLEGQMYHITSFDVGIGFRAEIKAKSLRKALFYLDNIIPEDACHVLDSVYTVKNQSGKMSVRFLKESV